MRVDSKSGHPCSDSQHHRGGGGQGVLYRGALKTFVSGAGQKTFQEAGHKMCRWIKQFPACTSQFQHTRGFLWEQCGFEACGLPFQVPSGLRWLWIRLMCHPECLIISDLAWTRAGNLVGVPGWGLLLLPGWQWSLKLLLGSDSSSTPWSRDCQCSAESAGKCRMVCLLSEWNRLSLSINFFRLWLK